MAPSEYDVAIVGAGIIGSAIARELAVAGHSVVVLEAEEVAGETSCRAMGHVGAYDDSEAQLGFTFFGRRLWEELSPELPPEVDFVRRGALWVARDAEEMAEVERKRAVYRRARVDVDVVDGRRLATMEPNLAPGLAGALWVPGDIVLDAAEATRYLARRASELGVEIRTHTPVRSLRPDGVDLGNGQSVRAGHVVLATGWQAPTLLPSLPIRPRKGHIVLTEPLPGYVRHQVTEVSYVRGASPTQSESITFSFQPRSSGRYLLGATRQYVGSSTEVDPAVVERLLERARLFLPGIREVPIARTWAGLRPAGPDAVPILGPMPGRRELLVAVAHEGIGITTALATGRLVREMIDGRPPSIPLEPFRPERLAAPKS